MAILVQNNYSHVPFLCNGLAHILMGFDNPVDPEVAVRLAQTAMEHSQPEEKIYWNAATTMVEAYYRAGRWNKAIEVLNEKVNASRAGASDYFCLAITHWRLGEREEARKWYERGIKEQKRLHYRVPHLRAEVEALLGIKQGKDVPYFP